MCKSPRSLLPALPSSLGPQVFRGLRLHHSDLCLHLHTASPCACLSSLSLIKKKKKKAKKRKKLVTGFRRWPDNPEWPHLKSLRLITSAKTLNKDLNKGHIHRFLRWGHGHVFVGSIIQPSRWVFFFLNKCNKDHHPAPRGRPWGELSWAEGRAPVSALRHPLQSWSWSPCILFSELRIQQEPQSNKTQPSLSLCASEGDRQ